ncbi:MAG: heparinase II/III family protein, partial [Armatimonadota bacterium]
WTMNNFAWKRNDGELLHGGSIAIWGSSHPYENTMVSLAGALAICDESEIARQFAEMAIHHIIGITNSYGEDEGWNEGPGYGNGKMKWLTDAVSYLQGTLPELEINKNEVLSRYCDFFARITPVGAKHCSFGNRGRNPRDWCSSRVTNFRRVAMLHDDPQAMANWYNTREWLKQEYESEVIPFSPWIDYCLSAYVDEPQPAVEEDPVKLFDLEGWVTASSAPPSDLEAQREAVSMTFHCRPRGGYGHSFRNENAFDIHAFGKTVAVGGGNTSNRSWFANHTMSHNTCLVNGQEQVAAKQHGNSPYGRIIAFDRGDNYVYWAGDATAAYGPETDMGKFVRHVLFVDNAYFVIFDELQMAEDADAGTFQWLYHMIPEVPLEFEEDTFRTSYAMDEVNVAVQHCAHVDDLTYENLPGGEGMINPITGEDVSQSDKWAKGTENLPDAQPANHIWVSHETAREAINFLTVIVPYRDGQTAPVIEPVTNRSVRVTFGGTQRLISFEPDENADVSVDCPAISE